MRSRTCAYCKNNIGLNPLTNTVILILTHQVFGLANDLMSIICREDPPCPCAHVVATVPVIILLFLNKKWVIDIQFEFICMTWDKPGETPIREWFCFCYTTGIMLILLLAKISPYRNWIKTNSTQNFFDDISPLPEDSSVSLVSLLSIYCAREQPERFCA